ncbi:MAG: circadian clock protein KaiC [Thermoplasmata archaeon]
MNETDIKSDIEKEETGIVGFDTASGGGLPKGRMTIVSGTAGSGKTIFATQFLVDGILNRNSNAVFVTFEETPEEICRDMKGFNWDLRKFEEEGKLKFVDISLPHDVEIEQWKSIIPVCYEVRNIIGKIENAVQKIGAKRVVIDSIGTMFGDAIDRATVRSKIFRISSSLRKLGVTSIMTIERSEEYGAISRYGVEEFAAENVVVLRNVFEEKRRRRTIEILKFRGTNHIRGEFPFTILPGKGIVAFPITYLQRSISHQPYTQTKVTSGSKELDEMCNGGFFKDSVIFVSGGPGCGKTVLSTQFIAGGVAAGEKGLLVTFDENKEALYRNALGRNIDLKAMEDSRKLLIHSAYPESMGIDEHLSQIISAIERFQPERIVIDSLSAIQRITSPKGLEEFIMGVTYYIKKKGITAIYTANSNPISFGCGNLESLGFAIADTIILLKYVEVFGEVHRGIVIMKMRSSAHDKEIREFTIDTEGIHIGKAFRNVSGILSGSQIHKFTGENDRIDKLFTE